jgi:hypothetical protein
MKKIFWFLLLFVCVGFTSNAQWFKPKGFKQEESSVMPVPQEASCRVYEHINYQGKSCGFSKSQPDIRNLCGTNWNDIVSSIKVRSGYKIVFYEHINYEGASWTFTSDTKSLVDFGCNDIPSSVAIYYNGKLQ